VGTALIAARAVQNGEAQEYLALNGRAVLRAVTPLFLTHRFRRFAAGWRGLVDAVQASLLKMPPASPLPHLKAVTGALSQSTIGGAAE
jgi:hypothetical protein